MCSTCVRVCGCVCVYVCGWRITNPRAVAAVAYAKNQELDQWMLFNDHRVTNVTPEEVQDRQAYLLFYSRDV